MHRDDVAAGDHDVVAAGSGLELGHHLLVALVGIVGHLDPELLLEVRDRVLGDVVRPVVDVELLLDRPQIRHGGSRRAAVAGSAGTILLALAGLQQQPHRAHAQPECQGADHEFPPRNSAALQLLDQAFDFLTLAHGSASSVGVRLSQAL